MKCYSFWNDLILSLGILFRVRESSIQITCRKFIISSLPRIQQRLFLINCLRLRIYFHILEDLPFGSSFQLKRITCNTINKHGETRGHYTFCNQFNHFRNKLMSVKHFLLNFYSSLSSNIRRISSDKFSRKRNCSNRYECESNSIFRVSIHGPTRDQTIVLEGLFIIWCCLMLRSCLVCSKIWKSCYCTVFFQNIIFFPENFGFSC